MENTVLTSLSTPSSDTIREITLLKNLIEETALMISNSGYPIRAFSNEALLKIPGLSINELKTCSAKLLQNLEFLTASASFLSRLPNKELIKNITSIMKLKVNDSFINNIEDNNIVEIYNNDCIQIFRNLKFYETTTYSLSDLLLFDWSELYYRPTQISQKIQVYINEVLTTDDPNLICDMNVPTHIIKEIKANPIQLCEIRFKKIAPVLDQFGNKAGLIVTCDAKSLLSDISHTGIDFI